MVIFTHFFALAKFREILRRYHTGSDAATQSKTTRSALRAVSLNVSLMYAKYMQQQGNGVSYAPPRQPFYEGLI